MADISYQLFTWISEATFMQHGAGQIDTLNSPTYYSFSLIHYSLHNNPEWNMSRCWRGEKWYCHAVTGRGRAAFMSSRVSNKDYPKFSQSRRRPLLGPSPGWKRLLALLHLRHNKDTMLNRQWPLPLLRCRLPCSSCDCTLTVSRPRHCHHRLQVLTIIMILYFHSSLVAFYF